MIFTFRIHGQGFRPESMVLAGSTLVSSPMEKVILSRYVSPTEIEVTINTDEFAAGLIHLSVLQTPMGLRSPTVTVNPGLRPNIPLLGVASAFHQQVASNLALALPPDTGFAISNNFLAHTATNITLAVGAKATITSSDPNPVNSRTQVLRINLFGTGFVAGCTFQMTGPSGAQSDTCVFVGSTQVRCDIRPNTPGTHQIVVINPPGVASDPYSFQIVP